MNPRLLNPLFTLRYDTEAGEVVKPRLLAREVHLHEGPRVNALGNQGAAWDIAVLDESGTDVTGRFTCFT
ncbi:hypothetical protein PV724_44510 [Streptomyces europaeiscabiei]|uniref:hypothetical protein n=1 Tax=Streptomyces europaeiscabiei TaxID=146819 RepID=UPI0029A5F90D|nr:hypothetical protein [Streptomyces europaeiscabiei]MDX3549541.1 hypothetical protein [Streptomyces europaeiscabiei]